MSFKPWLHLPARFSHDWGPWFLRQYTSCFVKRSLSDDKGFTKQGINFLNRFGTAGGLDKNGKDIHTWSALGAGFLEIGTVTPEPQSPNPGKIISRSLSQKALWNSMGFPNDGFEIVRKRVAKFREFNSDLPLLINIGKNRSTSIEEAHKDYSAGIHFFKEFAQGYVINISSPNTKDLRKLHSPENFKSFISPLLNEAEKIDRKIPLLIKISPDLPEEDFRDFLELLLQYPLGGVVLTNTTAQRNGTPPIPSIGGAYKLPFPSHGGVSGQPLGYLSKLRLMESVKIIKQEAPDRLIISVGGIMTPDHALERLSMGADLVEFYSGLIFYGPKLFRHSIELAKNTN